MRFNAPVLLYGAGREAVSTAAFLSSRAPGPKLFVTADTGAPALAGAEFIPPETLDAAIETHRFGLIVKSPGVPLHRPLFERARAAGIPVTSNLNLWGAAYRAGRRVIAITGTKGKSTTATLLHLMLTHSGIDAGLAGNVGLAPLDIADRHETIVLELSSYQTADMDFAPDMAGLTNLYPEHLDWHGSTERYYADKLRLLAPTSPAGFPVALGIPPDPATPTGALILRALGDPARLLPALPDGAEPAFLSAVAASRLKGAHNRANARLAARMALGAGATLDGVMAGIAAFAPLPHRLEDHRIGGLLFVDDSISTTPEATKAALAAYAGARIGLIAGGHERGQDYEELARLLAPAGVTVLACLPVTGARLAAAARREAPGLAVLEPDTLDVAMETLAALRERFDTLILSPGAPSYNQFRDFTERGARFVALAKTLFGPASGA